MKNMKKLFSKTVAAMLSITCMGSIMTTSFNGTPLFTPKLIADAEESPCVSFDEETGVLTLYGNIENMFSLANYSGDKRVKEVKALKGTVLPADCNKLFSRFELSNSLVISFHGRSCRSIRWKITTGQIYEQ